MTPTTPGPWTYDKRGNGKQQLLIRRADKRVIAAIQDEGRLGDARLIAAAPDMLKALKDVESELIDTDMEVPEYIEQAIAKAKGKEPTP